MAEVADQVAEYDVEMLAAVVVRLSERNEQRSDHHRPVHVVGRAIRMVHLEPAALVSQPHNLSHRIGHRVLRVVAHELRLHVPVRAKPSSMNFCACSGVQPSSLAIASGLSGAQFMPTTMPKLVRATRLSVSSAMIEPPIRISRVKL